MLARAGECVNKLQIVLPTAGTIMRNSFMSRANGSG